MNIWESKYRALAAGATAEEIAAAEQIIRAAIDMGASTREPASHCLDMLLTALSWTKKVATTNETGGKRVRHD